jgi:Zn-dependent protease with chaperone function
MYHLLGACLALAALLVINALGSLVAAGVWRGWLARCARSWSAATRARVIFALRAFPSVCAAACVTLLLLPSYIVHEPRQTKEVVSLKLAALALFSLTGIGLALWRGLAAWRETRRLAADWMRHGEPVRLEGLAIPAYRIRHAFPVIAVVGSIRPRLFIASQVLDSLTDDELSAALAHESAHLALRDNLKRVWLRVCRDLLTIIPCGRGLDRAWFEASEAAADERAARAGASFAINLASTLVKIARMAPNGASATMPAGAFLIDESVGGVACRVRHLTQLTGNGGAYDGRRAAALRLAVWVCPAAFFVALAAAAAHVEILATTHLIIEHVIRALG